MCFRSHHCCHVVVRRRQWLPSLGNKRVVQRGQWFIPIQVKSSNLRYSLSKQTIFPTEEVGWGVGGVSIPQNLFGVFEPPEVRSSDLGRNVFDLTHEESLLLDSLVLVAESM